MQTTSLSSEWSWQDSCRQTLLLLLPQSALESAWLAVCIRRINWCLCTYLQTETSSQTSSCLLVGKARRIVQSICNGNELRKDGLCAYQQWVLDVFQEIDGQAFSEGLKVARQGKNVFAMLIRFGLCRSRSKSFEAYTSKRLYLEDAR